MHLRAQEKCARFGAANAAHMAFVGTLSNYGSRNPKHKRGEQQVQLVIKHVHQQKAAASRRSLKKSHLLLKYYILIVFRGSFFRWCIFWNSKASVPLQNIYQVQNIPMSPCLSDVTQHTVSSVSHNRFSLWNFTTYIIKNSGYAVGVNFDSKISIPLIPILPNYLILLA